MLELLARVQARYLWRSDDTDRGATAVEYAIMVGMIALGIVSSVKFFGTSVQKSFNQVPVTWSQAG